MSAAKPLILCLEDELELAHLVADSLDTAGMNVQLLHRAAHVLPFLRKTHVNLMLLDVGLPDGSGFDVLTQIRAEGFKTPAMFLTANDSEADRVRGLDLGADDFLPKPFSFPELLARIRAILRRTETAHDTNISENVSVSDEPFNFCGTRIVPARLEMIFPNGAVEVIGKKELGILYLLATQPDTVITRRSLIHAVWGVHADVKSRSLDQYIVKIRGLLAAHHCSDAAFKTVHGVGYLYEIAQA